MVGFWANLIRKAQIHYFSLSITLILSSLPTSAFGLLQIRRRAGAAPYWVAVERSMLYVHIIFELLWASITRCLWIRHPLLPQYQIQNNAYNTAQPNARHLKRPYLKVCAADAQYQYHRGDDLVFSVH